ncbi:hypothetical protein BHE74_00004999 [Ensete ventricosum]|nr:hypothetical protein GW17_00022253 [Ensete ventricosum]RWW86232.1 hypothetical protein BHE74_00004999 [Ensete ventricosum]RZR90148.1 hypothetical protein BHM03_00017982 [Ensete ventricosum]
MPCTLLSSTSTHALPVIQAKPDIPNDLFLDSGLPFRIRHYSSFKISRRLQAKRHKEHETKKEGVLVYLTSRMCNGRQPKRQAGVAKTRKGKEAAGDEEMEGGREAEDGFCSGDSSDGWLWR